MYISLEINMGNNDSNWISMLRSDSEDIIQLFR